MDRKLTLAMDAVVIDAAKAFAEENNTSLSRLVEGYFFSLTVKDRKKDDFSIHSIIKSLPKIPKDLVDQTDINGRKARYEFLEAKYGL